jgi:hypothetical protein
VRNTDRLFSQQRNDRITVSMVFGDSLDLSQFVMPPLAE